MPLTVRDLEGPQRPYKRNTWKVVRVDVAPTLDDLCREIDALLAEIDRLERESEAIAEMWEEFVG